MKARRDVFQAIADPTRRAIIMLLTAGALTPNAVAEHFSSSRQAISRHLQILSECEIVKQEKQGREIYYELNPAKIKEIEKWVEELRKLWEARFRQLDVVLSKLKKNKK
ncbi:MAG: metalloregulator ArsR/SmtB family transcription factor [Cyclobacteriaceae bacterium]|nr:metalloregulator ArsR/SmtB family transcription factor [Cyclobacteriaceae bacterium]MCX7638366.1 metalloregulator ArsR/SmtB family transcription factor [Cyclobacteriaceae bacterium]MDW8331760.1 metalloregulator ArsR/SmtB family transcription factor [Cyclobacteriaceae bacterium]